MSELRKAPIATVGVIVTLAFTVATAQELKVNVLVLALEALAVVVGAYALFSYGPRTWWQIGGFGAFSGAVFAFSLDAYLRATGSAPTAAMASGGAAVLAPATAPKAPAAVSTPPNAVANSTGAVETLLSPVASEAYREAVAEVIHAMQPDAMVSVGGSQFGPDGARTVDVRIVTSGDGIPNLTLVDVVYSDPPKPVDVFAVDLAEAKRNDLGAKEMLICSNAGFTALARTKAKRIGIGLIAAMKEGDARVKT